MAASKDSGVCFSKNTPVFHSMTVSRAQPTQYAITGVQLAIASSGTSQKSSSGGNTKAFAWEYNSIVSFLEIQSFHSMLFFDLALSFL